MAHQKIIQRIALASATTAFFVGGCAAQMKDEPGPIHPDSHSLQPDTGGEQAEVDFDGAVIPDHIPALLGGHRAGVAYSIAYMRALLQAVNNEAGGPV